MDDYEEVSKHKVYGLAGEFTVGKGDHQLRALYLETKIRPGSEGSWDNILASHLVPWREVFDIERVSFDELLQRDLNDSRVAHDLIPYLIGDTSNAARFFPPILVVLVPKNNQGTGIEKSYPKLEDSEGKMSFSTLFSFSRKKNESGSYQPAGLIEFNPQRSAFIIVDGQHRAMAVLALHRQLTKTWGNNNYESYYKHIQVSAEDVKRLELPVCIVVFPDLSAESQLFKDGVTLDKACRELFLVVNRKAQPVSQARNLLLDDDDFAALMMRRTLSKFKERTEDVDSLARIYSFRYSDSEDEGRAVQSGKLEYSSAVYLHKLHSIGSFGAPKGFTFDDPADLSSGTHQRNSSRPVEMLLGTDLEKWQKLTKTSAKTHSPEDVKSAVSLLGDIVDIPILKLFDTFNPFAVHNRVLRQLRTRLGDLRADPLQNKAYTLLFEGSGSKEVFEEHITRLQNIKADWDEEGKKVSDYIENQLKDAVNTQKAIQRYERDIKRQRACGLFSINFEKFYPEADAESSADQQVLEQRSRSIFDTIATQAFQVGYLTAVLTLAARALPDDAPYPNRINAVEKTTDLILCALNAYFSISATRHETLSGLIDQDRSRIFTTEGPGLRALLGLSVAELNERQWPFFRYAILEILFSRAARKDVLAWLNGQADRLNWISVLELLGKDVQKLRDDYVVKAINAALKRPNFTDDQKVLRAQMEGAGKSAEEIEAALKDADLAVRKKVRDTANSYIKASTGELGSFGLLIKKAQEAGSKEVSASDVAGPGIEDEIQSDEDNSSLDLLNLPQEQTDEEERSINTTSEAKGED